MTESMKKFYPVIAALSHPTVRRVFAEIELGQFSMSDEDDAQVAKALTQLERARMIRLSKDSGYIVDTAAFRDLLKDENAEEGEALASISRFLREGKITQFPRKQSEREQLMRYVAAACFSGGSKLTEAQVDEKISVYHEDTALIRRYLVDHGIVKRAVDGSAYWLNQE